MVLVVGQEFCASFGDESTLGTREAATCLRLTLHGSFTPDAFSFGAAAFFLNGLELMNFESGRFITIQGAEVDVALGF